MQLVHKAPYRVHADMPDCEDCDSKSLYSLCSQQSSDLTASDLPGAGRTLGLLYSRWGRALESSMNRFAHRRGYGPDAVAAEIERTTFSGRKTGDGVEWNAAGGGNAQLLARCQRLIGYTRSDTPLTRMRTLEQVIQLITAQPRLRPFFHTPTVLTHVRSVTERSSISSNTSEDWDTEMELESEINFLSKQTLLCIEDNPLNEIVGEILQLPFHEDEKFSGSDRYAQTMLKLLEACRNPQFSFVAKRHMYSALNYLPWRRTASWNVGQFWSQLILFLEQLVSHSLNSGAADMEGTERLVVTLLLPRCRALHALDFPIGRARAVNCRCAKSGLATDEMRLLLKMLTSPGAKAIFPRAAAIADEVWTRP
ncbi:hypothetical protein DFH11DRAFT_814193 [Phellopilus nigrolimitatus]|nr:hypothetical protein DFH11DRAFT_814193 [Phellopilus nigrolimitatus]